MKEFQFIGNNLKRKSNQGGITHLLSGSRNLRLLVTEGHLRIFRASDGESMS